LAAIDGLELRALSASSPESGAIAGKKFGVTAAANADELVARDDVDLVVITVKVPDHHELALKALRANKSVLVEWPLDRTVEQAQELVTLAEANNVATFVGLQGRSVPAVRYLKDLIADGYVGEVLSTSLIGAGGIGARSTTGSRLYLFDRDNGANLLTIPFGHTIDGVNYVLGEFAKLKSVVATRNKQVTNSETGQVHPATSPDQVVVAGVLESGAVLSAHYHSEFIPGNGFRWEIVGTEGKIVVTGPSAHLQFGVLDILGAQGAADLTPLPVPEKYQLVAGLAVSDPGYAVAHQYHHVLADLTTGSNEVPDFAHALRRHQVLEKISASHTA
jgi:predicted dehydrogenase